MTYGYIFLSIRFAVCGDKLDQAKLDSLLASMITNKEPCDLTTNADSRNRTSFAGYSRMIPTVCHAYHYSSSASDSMTVWRHRYDKVYISIVANSATERYPISNYSSSLHNRLLFDILFLLMVKRHCTMLQQFHVNELGLDSCACCTVEMLILENATLAKTLCRHGPFP